MRDSNISCADQYGGVFDSINYNNRCNLYILYLNKKNKVVLARRAMGFKENVSNQMMSVLYAKEAKKGHDYQGEMLVFHGGTMR